MPLPLEGIRVLELGEMVGAAFAARWFADLGADVIKVEPAEGDRARSRGPFSGGMAHPERGGLFFYLAAGKRSVVLDLDDPVDRATLDDWLGKCHVLLHNLEPARAEALGLDAASLGGRHPHLVATSVTAFGTSGPYRDWRSEELNRTNAGGWCWLSPGALEDPTLPPLKTFGHQADFHGALAAATASFAGLFRSLRTGQGEAIDVSIQEAVAAILEIGLIGYTYMDVIATRHGIRGLNPWGIFECSDGPIFLSVIEQDQWERLVEFMGNPDWASIEIFEDFVARARNADALATFVQEWIGTWKVDDLFHQGQKRRICFAPVLDMRGIGEISHLRERGFFSEIEQPGAGRVRLPGPATRWRDDACRLRGPAPALGADGEAIRAELGRATPLAAPAPAAAKRPLEGVRIADFTWVWAGPFGAMQLAHLGAEVIKFESPTRTDIGRRLAVFPDNEPGINRSGYFNQWNQGKKSVELDLSHPDTPELVKRIVSECDVVIENFATGVMDRLGIGWEDLRAVNPKLVFASISGYGSDGPFADYMGYGPAMGPLSGLSQATGYPGGPPRETGISVGDPVAGMSAAAAICAALVDRERNGIGQYIDISLWESTTALAIEAWLPFAISGQEPVRMGNRDPLMSPHGMFSCAGEDRWVSIACANEAEWRALCEIIDPALASDPRFASAAERKRNEPALEETIGGWTASRDRWEITRMLQDASIPAFPSLDPRDLAEDPHLAARGYLEELEHPEVGRRKHSGIPWQLRDGPNGVRFPAPCLGQHTEEVLGDLLHLGRAEISALRERGILG